uniref:Uncharacterized protein n=1 Tax=Odontella aurita TaxID=265563 RepID=A0A7S4JGF5_9STRA|mmetsp:Transcript_46044/g.139756  ORF Transcript_46044/g.139756 Transcript_46044/m.139756 type:complete len:103 (+) Transcript_46044:297-605(+)
MIGTVTEKRRPRKASKRRTRNAHSGRVIPGDSSCADRALARQRLKFEGEEDHRCEKAYDLILRRGRKGQDGGLVVEDSGTSHFRRRGVLSAGTDAIASFEGF